MTTPAQLLSTLPPDHQSSLANLAARLHQTDTCQALQHPLLDGLEDSQTIILLLIDGMGEAQIQSLCPQGWLSRQAKISLRSVFPSTTTAAITTLMTGLPPSQHSLLSWHLWSPELAAIATPLPLSLHWPTDADMTSEEMAAALYSKPSALRNGRRTQYVMQPARIAGSPYSQHHGGEATHLPWQNYDELFENLQKLSTDGECKYVYAYIPDLDSAMHDLGTQHPKVSKLLQRIDGYVKQLAARLGSDCTVLITADHGQLDIPAEHFLFINDFPEIAAMLAQPLSGEPRAAFCHVKPEFRTIFSQRVSQALGHAVDCVPASKALNEAWFGPPPYHQQLAARLGDYILMPKDDWAILQTVGDAPRPKLRGNHGGLSRAEMEIPLFVIRRNEPASS